MIIFALCVCCRDEVIHPFLCNKKPREFLGFRVL
jgi:hypothetical protein